MNFHIIIPARYQSTRLPGKVLADIGGKSMIQHVYERALESGADSIVIATDDERIKTAAESFGATVCMTNEGHNSGTERIAEVANILDYSDDDIIVGLQADEPFMPSKVIQKLAEDLTEHDNVKVASVCRLIEGVEELFNPNITKVILNHRKYAMFFSRAPIPWERDNFSNSQQRPQKLIGEHYRHVGLYAYRASFLPYYIDLTPCEAEELELLEQLRILWHGGRIHMLVVKDAIPMGVDTPDDLERVRRQVSRKHNAADASH